jgi:hypothetical protein
MSNEVFRNFRITEINGFVPQLFENFEQLTFSYKPPPHFLPHLYPSKGGCIHLDRCWYDIFSCKLMLFAPTR